MAQPINWLVMARKSFFSHAFLSMAFLLAAGPAAACLPPPPGTPEPMPPPRDEVVRTVLNFATDIVAGKVVSGEGRDGELRFLVEHVYKGKLRRGAVLKAPLAWGIDAPMCFGLIPPPPVPRGTRGTIYFYDRPELKFLYDEDLERAFAMGLLQRRPARRRR